MEKLIDLSKFEGEILKVKDMYFIKGGNDPQQGEQTDIRGEEPSPIGSTMIVQEPGAPPEESYPVQD